jgi:hypothetical protein
MNQGTQGYRLMKKNQGSKTSWDCPFKPVVEGGGGVKDNKFTPPINRISGGNRPLFIFSQLKFAANLESRWS